jgi:hypothetical protein
LLCVGLQDGTTSLKNAVQGNHGEVASLLVENGANPNDVYKVRHHTNEYPHPPKKRKVFSCQRSRSLSFLFK